MIKAVMIAAALALMTTVTSAQTAPKPSPFDAVTGIVFTCSQANGHLWTVEACNRLGADFRKRAEALKLRFSEVLITADFSRGKRNTVNGFDEDKAVRVFWNFKEIDTQKSIQAGLSSNRVWEPTTKDIPNVAPGQRIPVNFYAQSVIFVPGTTLSVAEPLLKQISDNFFDIGEGKI